MLRKLIITLCIFTLIIIPQMVIANPSLPFTVQLETLSLDKCLELAAENSQQIKAAAKSVEIAKAAVKEVEGGFWPKLDYSILAMKAEEPIYPYIVDPYRISTEGSGAAVSLTEPLYLGGKLINGVKLTKDQLNMALENERKAKQQLTFQVKQAFYQVWLAERLLKVAQSSYDNLEHHVAQVDNYFQVGTVSRFELLRAKVQRDSLKPQVITAQNSLKFATLNLAILLGLPKERLFTVEYDSNKIRLPEQFNVGMEQVLEAAYQNRPEMRQIKQAEKMSQLQMKLAEAGYKPKVVLIGQYQEQSLDYSTSSWNDDKYWTLTLNITGNIFDGFATSAKVTGAKENVDLSSIKESGLRDQIRLDVEQSVQSIQESLEVIHANQSNIDMAKESLELTQARFEEGMATTMDIMDSQLASDQALSGYYRGIALYLTAEAKLDLADGKD
ncbi:MAG TPA: hypothetical protein DDW50_12560 [Firmicutes bacterium]|jgi:outer membrane protein|nr:hypothetical protein [Bacillota bacterium]